MRRCSAVPDGSANAVCCAPIKSTPSERPRWAMSINVSRIGDQPSRGAYLLSSSSTMIDKGNRPLPSFSSWTSLIKAPTTKRCAASWRSWISTTVTASRDRSMRRLSPAEINCPMRERLEYRRRMNAVAVPPATRPVHPGSGSAPDSGSRCSPIASTRSDRSRITRSPSRPPPGCRRPRASPDRGGRPHRARRRRRVPIDSAGG